MKTRPATDADLLPEARASAAFARHAPERGTLVTGDGLHVLEADTDAAIAALAPERAPSRCHLHHAGLGGDADDPELVLWCWLQALRNALSIAEPVPTDATAMRETLPNWLARAAAAGGFRFLLLDAHRLREQEAMPFDWLPDWLPKGVSVTVTGRAGPGLMALKARGAHQHALPLQALAADSASPDPMSWSATTQAVARLLWAAFDGLTRDALSALTGQPHDAIAAAVGELDGCLMANEGRYRLAGSSVRDRIAHAMLADLGARQALHRRCAEHAQSVGIEPGHLRQAAWHRAAAGEWQRLHALLCAPEWLAAMDNATHRFVSMRLWQALGGADLCRQALADCVQVKETTPEALLGAARLHEVVTGEVAPLRWYQRAGALAEAAGTESLHFRALEYCAMHAEGDGEQSMDQLTHVLAWREQQSGVAAADTLSTRHRLASCAEATGDVATAITHYRAGIDAITSISGVETPSLIPWLSNLAAAERARGALREADTVQRRALALARQQLGAAHPTTAASCDQLAACAYAAGDYPAAEALYREALGITEACFGPSHAATAAGLHNLGTVLDALQRFREAEACHRRALALREQLFGEQHMDTATSLHNLAAVLQATGELAEAEQCYRRALEVWYAVTGEDHAAFVTTLNNLAELLRERGAWSEAEPLYRAGIEGWRRLSGESHPHTLMALAGLARLYVDGGKPELAEPLLEHVIEMTGEVMGSSDGTHIDAVCLLAGLLRDDARRQAASVLLVDTLAAVEGTLGMISPRVQKLRRALAAVDAAETPLH